MSDNIEDMMTESGALPPEPVFTPSYKVDAESKIPVSKKLGAAFKARIDAEIARRDVHAKGWDECIRYYNNSQLSHRSDGNTANASNNRYFAIRKGEQWVETENLAYANVTTVVPLIYAKNPSVEFTTDVDDFKPFVQRVEKLVNKLSSMTIPPGLNMAMHGELAVTMTEITNIAWAEYGFTQRNKSADEMQSELIALADAYANAKDEKELREIEGQIMAIEEEIAVATPAGPYVRIHLPHNVVPLGATLPDFSDAKAIAIREYYPTAYLNAKYGEKGEDGRYYSIYEPTVVVTGTSDTDSMHTLLNNNGAFTQYGYKNKEDYERALMTECWRIWDKTTRRVYLFAANRWDWPIWAENDPHGLPMFWPIEPLVFNLSPGSAYARSPMTYYLDQADAINDIHTQFARERASALHNVLYDDSMPKDAVETLLSNTGKPTAKGVRVPEGRRLEDMLLTKPSAILKAQHLFDTERLYRSMDRVSGITDMMRGVQFKTNTTNKAIESYHSSTGTRLDKKISAIEQWYGRLFYGIGFLCARYMRAEDVDALIGPSDVPWQNYDAMQLRSMFLANTVGGSTQKLSGEAKKAMALETSRLLADIADKAPNTSVKIILNMLREAFDDFPVPPGAFDQLDEEINMAMQRGNSVQGAQGGGISTDAPPLGLQEVAQAIDMLPPGAKIALGQALAEGIPVGQAVPEIIRQVETEGQM